MFGALPRVLAAVASGAGATVVLVGAAWSAWRLWRRSHGGSETRPYRAARLVGANLLIAAGTLVLGAGGLFNSVFDAMTAFAATLLVGITMLFAGFLLATTAPRASSEAPGGA